MSELAELLVVQGHDTTLDQLRHRKNTLPERAALQQLEDELSALEQQRQDVLAQIDVITARQEETERETEATVKRIGEIDARMRSGTMAARDLTAMQTEIDHLQQRRRDLDDRTLEAMEEREPVETILADIDERRMALDDRAGQARVALADAEVAIDAEITREESARAAAAAVLPPALLEQYASLRGRYGGIAVAPLVGGQCGGCHLKLSATEMDRIKKLPPDSAAQCEQCGRILVRPA